MGVAVLITTANNPPVGIPFLKMTNVAMRIITAKASVFFWAAHGAKKIVIADATGGVLLSNEDILLLSQIGVEVEQISYHQNHDLVKLKGKGFGEGELLSFALENSKMLKNESNFFKCTGKIFCRNFDKILQLIESNSINNLYWRHLGEGDGLQQWVDLRFFYTEMNFCKEVLIPAYMLADDHKAAAEYFAYISLTKNLLSAKSLRPHLSGFAGGTGKPYFDSSLGFLDFNFPCFVSKSI